MTLCKQLWITSACACSSSAGSKLLSSRLRAPINGPMTSSPSCPHLPTPTPQNWAYMDGPATIPFRIFQIHSAVYTCAYRPTGPLSAERQGRIHQVCAGKHGFLPNGCSQAVLGFCPDEFLGEAAYNRPSEEALACSLLPLSLP